MKHLRSGANRGRCCMSDACVGPPFPVLIEEIKNRRFILFISTLPVNAGHSANVVGGQLYAFHQCC